MLLSFPVFPRDLQAWGNNFAATIIIAGTLVWHILHPSDADQGGRCGWSRGHRRR